MHVVAGLTIELGTVADVDAPALAAAATVITAPFTTYHDARQIAFAVPEDDVGRRSSSHARVSGR